MNQRPAGLNPAILLMASVLLAACASERAQPLPVRPGLAGSVAQLDRSRPDAAPIPADRPLTLGEVGLLAAQNSPDLRALRAQQGVARAQVIQAGLLPDLTLSGSYNVLLAGPAVANAIGATLTGDITSLISLSARRLAASKLAQQVDANTVWQEWQTISRAQTLTIDLIEQGRLLHSLRQTLAILQRRAATSQRGVAQGNATLQTLAPDIAAVTSLQTQLDAAVLAQDERWQSLDALLGLAPDIRPMLNTAVSVPAISNADAAAMVESLPTRRPDLIALQLGYASQEASLRAAVLGQFPALMLGPNYGDDTSRVQSFGPSVSIGLPIFNRNRGAVAVQRATREQLRAEYEARLATAAAGARALLANLALQTGQLAAAKAGLAMAQRLAADAEAALRAGLIDELSYVQLVVARLEKERQVIGLEQQVLDGRTALATLLGAGLPPVHLTVPKQPSLI
ncbi:TolC family protein [Rhodopila sp.]|uniref:TolC family protein n=1 Tax=Rhodopila sp. TaxID=2480087 RepID=UPI003D0FB3F2